MLFTSDNWSGIHPTVLEAMMTANIGNAPAYGADDVTARAIGLLRDIFEQDITVGFVATGTAANALALACMTPPWGAILAHKNSHINVDECGATEFYTAGAKIIPLEGQHGKLTPDIVRDAMKFFTPQQPHRVVPKVLSLTQGTECGTVYSADEIGALCDTAKSFGLKVHLDGARFSNACARGKASAAAMTARAGVDVLTFGGTKNGCLAAEAIIFFDQQCGEQLAVRQRRAGHVFSKYRFLSAQWLGFLQNDLWLRLAKISNTQADRLSKSLAASGVCTLVHPTEINEVFVTMPDDLVSTLKEQGATFYDWIQPGDPYKGKLRRFVTSYMTTDDQVTEFSAALRDYINR
ncbi:threonine aldolase family protein [Parvularcula sp. LCG005]|uniref:threonine aldolase family protein n=1 Tax=Parvularcula sp. LCG005 TaxID=3078805 RepID=UPI0029438E39|nr:beta-eliminating lyase-related protein [Parvularcula sp. LCG005]WOI53300.1 beta-eliminating lyase-related protein [Parvularcula sp. LCG005]